MGKFRRCDFKPKHLTDAEKLNVYATEKFELKKITVNQQGC